MTQYRIVSKAPAVRGVSAKVNVREEASTKARVLFQVANGAIVQDEPTPRVALDGDKHTWRRVTISGWMREDMLKALE